MTPYKFCWEVHKWLGIILCLILINISVTGLLLLEKKHYDWIQPPTQKGQAGRPTEFVTLQAALDSVLDCNHPDFATVDAIDRIDIRPGKRVYKVLSKTNYGEIQIDAITGQVLSVGTRQSDRLEQWHDGSLFGEWVHAMLMPLVAVANIVLALTGLYLWLGPKFKRKKKAKLRNKGVALLLTVFMVALLSAVAIGLLQLCTLDVQMMSNHVYAAEALAVAQTGLNNAFAEIRTDSSWISKTMRSFLPR